jgi:hypothetical protein
MQRLVMIVCDFLAFEAGLLHSDTAGERVCN